MPVLNVGSDTVAQDLVAAAMLFPDDIEEREYFLTDKFLHLITTKWEETTSKDESEKRTFSNALGATFGDYIYLRSDWRRFYSYFSNIHQKQSIIKRTTTAMRYGQLAGLVFENIYRFNSSVRESAKIVTDIAHNHPSMAQFAKMNKGIDEKTIQTRIWSKYNKVSHLWCAYMQFRTDAHLNNAGSINFESLQPLANEVFDIQLKGGFEGFLEVVEKLQTWGIKKRLPRSVSKLLSKDPWIFWRDRSR